MNRIDRLSALLIMLQSSLSVKSSQIMERFDIGIRTVYRDIKALEEAGVPIAGDSRIGYSLVDGYKLPPLMFTQDEAFAFIAAEKLVDKYTNSNLLEKYKSGVDKIRAVMRFSEKVQLEAVEDKIGSLNFNKHQKSDSNNKLQILMSNISRHHQIQIIYYSYNSGQEDKRLVDPIGIFFSMANWYMIGYCHQKLDYRTFKLERIHEIIETGISVTKKHPSLDSFLDKLENEIDLLPVDIEVSRTDLKIIDESKYYQGLVSEKKKENSVELHFMAFSLSRFARWYMSYIDIAKIIYPKELKDFVREMINNRTI